MGTNDALQDAAAVELRSAFARARAITTECGLAYAEVDAILDTAPGTFRTMCIAMPSDHPAESRMRMLADALDYATGLLGDRLSVAIWLRRPHALMDGMSPTALLASEPGALRAVRDALRAEWLEAGSEGR